MTDFASIAGFIGAAAFTLLAALLFQAYRGSVAGKLLLVACATSAGWFAASALYYSDSTPPFGFSTLAILEVLRNVTWFGFATAVLLTTESNAFRVRIKLLGIAALIVAVALIAVTVMPLTAPFESFQQTKFVRWSYILSLTMPVMGLLYTEQIFRNTHPDARWGIKHLCIGLAGIFAYDLYLYAEAVLFNTVSSDVWSARGIANAFAVPMLAVSARRNTDWNMNVFVSRRVVFHSTAVLGVGVYLLLMSAAGFYLKTYGGTWGGALRAAFIFAAMLFLITLAVSSQTRSRLRIFLAKHFYVNKYEYGEVWLKLTEQLSRHNGDAATLQQVTTKAIADILDSTGAVLWHKDADGNFVVAAEWLLNGNYPKRISSSEAILKYLESSNETIDLKSAAATLDTDKNIIPKFILDIPRAWLVVPILHGPELMAFVVLLESRSDESITWEDRDLLKTVSRQAGSYMALLRTTDALSELRQFEAFNQLSAFLVHDLKNVIAQLSLIVKNSDKYRDNPEFIADSFTTISDAVSKMNRMLTNLKQGHKTDIASRMEDLDVTSIVATAVKLCDTGTPIPVLVSSGEQFLAQGDPESLASVLEHLIQNAQDATHADGDVRVSLSQESDDFICIEISDDGTGMDADFIKNRLFKPFDSTKGKAGMGIGAYESRYLITEMGGTLIVESELGIGTTFRILLPSGNKISSKHEQLALAE